MKRIAAFILGIREFKLDSTTSYDPPLIEWYDVGREFAHRVTLRRYEVG